MKKLSFGLLGLLFFALPFDSKAETAAAYGVSEGEGPLLGLGLEQQSVGRLSALNTETGEHTNAKYFTTRAPGNFTAMARNAAGTLYAIQEPNRLVTIDETTGIATDAATLIDSAEMTFVKCPAMAFVPGSTEELYAIIKREMYYDVLTVGDTLPSIETGFILVTIDVATGQITETGIFIGGQFGNGLAHGLIYDANLGRLIHGYYEDSPGDISAAGSTIEVIDPSMSSVVIAQYNGMEEMNFPPAEEEEVLADAISERPRGFQGMAGIGNGNLFAYANSGNSGLFSINVSAQAIVDEPEPGDVLAVPAEIYVWDSYRVPLMNYFYSSVKAMDLTSDSQNLLIDSGGELFTYDMMGALTDDPIITTSVGGFPLYVQSIATEPGSGRIFGLSRNGKRRGPPRVMNKGLVTMVEETSSGVGLVILDPNGPEMTELTGLDVEFLGDIRDEELIEPKGDRPVGFDVYSITSIAFDENGQLFGYDEDYGQIVRIDLTTGQVTPFADIEFDGFNRNGALNLEYNPEDGNFYLLTYGYLAGMEKGGPSQLTLFSVSPAGQVSQVPLVGDFPPMRPNSFVFGGMGTFYCTTEGYGPYEYIFQIDVNGNVTVLGDERLEPTLAMELDQFFYTTGLALLGPAAISDVSVGTTRSRLRGNNIYNRSGQGQSVKLLKRGKTLSADFYSKVENDGNYPGLFELRGTKGKGKNKISYFQGRKNVTAAMAKGYSLPLEAGKSANFKVSLSRKGSGKWVSNNRISAS
ncbi:MAG: hypothetical protein P1U87_23245, partial [Verrucomicrobiales bacterium]|nr:hypothetical protein [Verrucomicrobiales bacterium]